MDRIIKFSAKSSVTDEYVCGNLIQDKNGNQYIIPFEDIELDGHHLMITNDKPMFIKEETIGQFTLKKDSNDIEIYEGDKIRVRIPSNGFAGWSFIISEVEFIDGVFGVKLNNIFTPLSDIEKKNTENITRSMCVRREHTLEQFKDYFNIKKPSNIDSMQLNKEDIDFNTRAIKDSYFKYIVFKLLEWHKEKIGKEDLSSFSRLKVLKLLFFVSSVTSKEYPNGLFDIFDKFYAMSYGPVESDIFNNISIGNYDEWFQISNKIITKGDFFNEIPSETINYHKYLIDITINQLKEINDDIILYTHYELIDLSYKWDSWRDAMNIAKMIENPSEKMKIKQIIKDSKIKDNYKL